MKRIRTLGALLLILALIGCNSTPAAQPDKGELLIFAAASLTDAFEALAQSFRTAHPDSDIRFNFAGSQQLAAQLDAQAPADLFASASPQQIDDLIEAGRIARGSAHVFAHNRLAIVVPTANPAGITSLSDLASTGVTLVLAAPAVPAGQYARALLNQASNQPDYGPHFSERVLANVVSNELNVRAVLAKVRLGEADAGIVYRSDIPPNSRDLRALDLPAALNPPLPYTIAPLIDAPQPLLAQAFIAYLLSPAGQQILIEHGLLPAQEAL